MAGTGQVALLDWVDKPAVPLVLAQVRQFVVVRQQLLSIVCILPHDEDRESRRVRLEGFQVEANPTRYLGRY